MSIQLRQGIHVLYFTLCIKNGTKKMTDPFKYVIHLGRFDCTHDLPDGRPSVFLSHLGNSEKANALALRHILPASVSPPSESV